MKIINQPNQIDIHIPIKRGLLTFTITSILIAVVVLLHPTPLSLQSKILFITGFILLMFVASNGVALIGTEIITLKNGKLSYSVQGIWTRFVHALPVGYIESIETYDPDQHPRYRKSNTNDFLLTGNIFIQCRAIPKSEQGKAQKIWASFGNDIKPFMRLGNGLTPDEIEQFAQTIWDYKSQLTPPDER